MGCWNHPMPKPSQFFSNLPNINMFAKTWTKNVAAEHERKFPKGTEDRECVHVDSLGRVTGVKKVVKKSIDF